MEAFNKFGEEEHTKEIPAMLLADKRQGALIGQAKQGEHRKLVSLPLKVRELRAALLQLLGGVERRPPGTY